MWGSVVVYVGLVALAAGLLLTIKPVRRLRIPTRGRAIRIAGFGLVTAIAGCVLPAPESRIGVQRTRLDEFVPVWQFSEIHSRRIAAPPERVYEALKRVCADDIALFNTLTWIRRGGRSAPPSILNAGGNEPILAVALKGGFVVLTEEAPGELVVGTAVIVPPGTRGTLTPELFRTPPGPGFVFAAMNFLIVPDGAGSLLSTETRVFANSPGARRGFAPYWRLIYPGSALIRRMWLRAIDERATAG